MSKQKSQKRPSGVMGMKSLIASTAVAVTMAGWAVLPSNDPQYANAEAQAIETVTATPIAQATNTPTGAIAYPTATVTQVPTTQSLLAQPSSTPTIELQVTATPTTQPTATTQPAPVTRTRSSR